MKKGELDRYGNTLKYFKKYTQDMRSEIVKIAKSINPKVNMRTYKNYISEYATKNAMEFFAECFANYRCGKPNIWGEAMGKWLEQRKDGKGNA